MLALVSVHGVFLYFFIYKNHADKERDYHFDIQRSLKIFFLKATPNFIN